jgi:primosomal protein N' (replication factor Y)
MTGGGSARYAEVVLPVPVSRAYTYQIPDGLADRVVPGARVVVPVRRRSVVGIVTAVDVPPPESGVAAKALAAAPDAEPALSPALLELGRWMSDYYGAPLGLALRAILPGPLWSVAKPAGPPPAVERLLVLAETGIDSLLERDRLFKRAPKRRAAYEAVEALGGSAPVAHLMEQLKLSRGALDGLVKQGLARFALVPETRDPFAGLSSPPPPHLTDDQRDVVAAIAATPVAMPVLLHGVTGSGKTLVYLDVLREIVASGRGAILLVPEIALTPQTVARVRGVFGDQVAVLHSGLSDGERADAWRALRRGERLVAVGPRSAVFAPVQRLGAIVVDEEHETSYKQGSLPRYHARDAAAVRAQLEGARLILGSATPSLETLDRAGPDHHPRASRPNRRAAAAARRGDRLADRPPCARGRPDPVERGVGHGRRRGAGARRAGDPAAQPARICDVRPMPCMRQRAWLSALRDRLDRAPHALGHALPLLRSRRAHPRDVPRVRPNDAAVARLGDATARAVRGPAVSACPDRAYGSRYDHE